MAWPLGKLNPEDSTRCGTKGRSRPKNCFRIKLREILPMAITGTRNEYHLCFRINRKYIMSNKEAMVMKLRELLTWIHLHQEYLLKLHRLLVPTLQNQLLLASLFLQILLPFRFLSAVLLLPTMLLLQVIKSLKQQPLQM